MDLVALRAPDAIARAREVFDDLRAVAVFGSRARGTEHAGSDLDLLLVFGPGRLPRRSDYEAWDRDVEPRLGPLVSPHFVAWPETPERLGGLWREVSRDGVVLWEIDGELSRALAGLRTHVERRGDRRRSSHGHPYWVLG
jgi:predicted nucleotidyltransferase